MGIYGSSNAVGCRYRHACLCAYNWPLPPTPHCLSPIAPVGQLRLTRAVGLPPMVYAHCSLLYSSTGTPAADHMNAFFHVLSCQHLISQRNTLDFFYFNFTHTHTFLFFYVNNMCIYNEDYLIVYEQLI